MSTLVLLPLIPRDAATSVEFSAEPGDHLILSVFDAAGPLTVQFTKNGVALPPSSVFGETRVDCGLDGGNYRVDITPATPGVSTYGVVRLRPGEPDPVA